LKTRSYGWKKHQVLGWKSKVSGEKPEVSGWKHEVSDWKSEVLDWKAVISGCKHKVLGEIQNTETSVIFFFRNALGAKTPKF
jgi:hypothetical protein